MGLIRHLKTLAVAAYAPLAMASASGCANEPICDFDREIVETIDWRIARLGENYESCQEAIPGHNDIRRRRINIVFVGVGYEFPETQERSRDALDCDQNDHGILAHEPFASNMDNFNFWIASQEPSEPFVRGEDAIDHAIEQASSCNLPNRTIVTFVNDFFRAYAGFSAFAGLNLHEMNLDRIGVYQSERPMISDWGCTTPVEEYCGRDIPLGTLATRVCTAIDDLRGDQDPRYDIDICPLITRGGDIPFSIAFLDAYDSPGIVVHGLGHSVFGFRDEYVERESSDDEGYLLDLQGRGRNCFVAQTREECEENAPWAGMAGCYQGCGYVMEVRGTPVWRSERVDTMSVSRSGESYGTWNELTACHVIHAVTQNTHGICAQFDEYQPGSDIGVTRIPLEQEPPQADLDTQLRYHLRLRDSDNRVE